MKFLQITLSETNEHYEVQEVHFHHMV